VRLPQRSAPPRLQLTDQAIQAIRAEAAAGLTQKDLAGLIGMRPQTLNQWVKRAPIASPIRGLEDQRLKRLAKVIGLPVAACVESTPQRAVLQKP
jgi:hypothetical protein